MSPQAKMCGWDVVSVASTLTPALPYSTPAASRSRPSVFGLRPVAIKTASVVISWRSSEPSTVATTRPFFFLELG